MSWDYAWAADGTNLSDYLQFVKQDPEGAPSFRGRTPIIPNRNGDLFARRSRQAQLIVLTGTLRYTDSAGAVTDPDGAEGHAYENYAALKRLFSPHRAAVQLTKTLPHIGNVQTDVVLAGPIVNNPRTRHLVRIPLRLIDSFWEEAGAANSTGITGTSSIATGGDSPIRDATLTFTAAGRLTHDSSGEYVEIAAGAFPGSDVIVDMGAGTVLQGGSPVDQHLLLGSDRWMEFEPAATVGLTASAGTITVGWRDKWA